MIISKRKRCGLLKVINYPEQYNDDVIEVTQRRCRKTGNFCQGLGKKECPKVRNKKGKWIVHESKYCPLLKVSFYAYPKETEGDIAKKKCRKTGKVCGGIKGENCPRNKL